MLATINIIIAITVHPGRNLSLPPDTFPATQQTTADERRLTSWVAAMVNNHERAQNSLPDTPDQGRELLASDSETHEEPLGRRDDY